MQFRFTNRKAPVEIAGYVDRQIWVVDIIRGTASLRWFSVINVKYAENEGLPWLGDSMSE